MASHVNFRRRLPGRLGAAVAVLLPLALLACVGAKSRAVIVDYVLTGEDGKALPDAVNTTAPADDPGWYRHPEPANNVSGIYMGNQWMLTATHVGVPGQVNLNGTTYKVVPNSAITLTNPTTAAGAALSVDSDLRMYRLAPDEATGLAPEDLDDDIGSDPHGTGLVSIATSTPSLNTVVTMIGSGDRRVVNTNHPDGHFTWNKTETHHGFQANPQQDDQRLKTWGQNRINSSALLQGPRPSLTTVVVEVPTGQPRDIIGQVMRFDNDQYGGAAGLPFEAAGWNNDSGGPVFVKEGGEWKLSGLMHAITKPSDLNRPVFGNLTIITDLSNDHYKTQIEALLANDFDAFEAASGAPYLLSGYSIAGDINLDGVVSGDGTGNIATDDVAAFVAGWGYASDAGDVYSWMNGDLNLDGVTDAADFLALRAELGGGVAGLQVPAAILAATPEPASAVLLLVAGLLAPRRRR